MLPLYSVHFVMLLAFAVVYYKAADIEDAPRMLWAGLSIGVYVLTWQFLGFGWLGCILGQVGLFVALTLFRMLRGQQQPRD